MVSALEGALASGVIFAIMALGVYLTFRILDFPDLTVDGSFATGGAAAAAMIASGYAPLTATVVAMVLGCAAGIMTGLLHTKGKINALLSGILSMIALYSINLRIMGNKPNEPLLGLDTVFTQVQASLDTIFSSLNMTALVSVGLLVILIKLAVDWFLHTEIGLAIRATGDNERMIRSFAANTDHTKILGLALSNGMVALSGALFAQFQGFADVNMGIGMIIIGLASVIIGEAIFGDATIRRATIAVIGGAIIYRIIVAIALRVGLNPSDMKLVTAVIVMAALITPRLLQEWRAKRHKVAEAGTSGQPVRGDSHVDV